MHHLLLIFYYIKILEGLQAGIPVVVYQIDVTDGIQEIPLSLKYRKF